MKPFRFLFLPCVLTLCVFLNSFSLLAAVANSATTTVKPYTPSKSVKRYSKSVDSLKFGNLIAVYVDAKAFDSTINMSNEKQIRLWINGCCYKNNEPLFVDHAKRCFIFRIKHDTSAAAIWRMFDNYDDYFKNDLKELSIRLGTEEKIFPLSKDLKATDKQTIYLQIRPQWLPWVLYALFLVVVSSVLIFAPGIIRDTGKYALPGIILAKKRSAKTDPDTSTIRVYDIPFSMARVQLFFWTLVVTLCMIHIWSFTGSLLLPGASVLLLLGISGGTYFVGKLIDQTADLPAGMSIQTFISNFLQEHQSEGFIPDILSDNNSINLHRLQLLIFTLFIGIQFMASVLFELRFPEMSATTLAFMGISSGMYAGMKPKENT